MPTPIMIMTPGHVNSRAIPYCHYFHLSETQISQIHLLVIVYLNGAFWR
jgi:hypothetical protein